MIAAHDMADMVAAFERGEGVRIALGRDRLAQLVRYWQARPEYEGLLGGADLAGSPANAAEVIARVLMLLYSSMGSPAQSVR